MKIEKTIPLLRIFDVDKAREFYIDWLGFQEDWVHQFEENTPYYIQISRGELTFHLTEHYGDCTPGGKVFIDCSDLESFFNELQTRPYKYYRPSIEEAFWGANIMSLTDPFGNRLLFNEYKKA
ncbi:glyoxalase superfamily protein [Arcicella aquatica]|uniref:Bleomycin resistance protein n=1 Tax=Arcicella aquatica TaxID=217141 RepID=A0ABU5QML4_9BACT|nr:glyoxalase superfamily protein [Arcicella aquatica]MEA5258301.1 glyoxalase superfamily protein [Arcicella aquatica]